MPGEKILVVGGIRSGKSKWAEKLALSDRQVVYIATAQVWDEEMARRVNEHKIRRPSHWQTVEEPQKIACILNELNQWDVQPTVLIDCLTLWVTNLLLSEMNLEKEFADLVQTIKTYQGKVILVSNEVGLGGIASNQLTRTFGDALGTLHQLLGEICNKVYFVWCGIAIDIKKHGERI